MNTKYTAKPTPEPPCEKLLRRICNATFPKDAKEFSDEELSLAELFIGYTRPREWDDRTFKLAVLLATQARELKKDNKRLRRQVDELKQYHSPLWEEVWKEPCPIREAELRRKAEDEDARISEERRKERHPLARALASLGDEKLQTWRSRDRRRVPDPLVGALWHEPMTVIDFHEASGLSRRTILNILRGLRARPIACRKRRNEPALYDRRVNAAFLCEWLTRYVKRPDDRRGWIVRILDHCKFNAPHHYTWLKQALHPAIQSLKSSGVDFKKYQSECEKLLHPRRVGDPAPTPTSSSKLYQQLRVAPAFLAVGKTLGN